MKYYTLKVTDIRTETHDAVTVMFKQPALKRIKYLPGQYLSVIFRINGRRYVRPYSFSSAPGIDDTLNITVKRVPAGVVSNHIIDRLKAGDLVEVMEPMGDFTIPADVVAPQHIYLWGAGSGITPLISIAKHALHNKLAASVTLVYGNRHYDAILLRTEIEELSRLFAGKFAVQHHLTQYYIDDANPAIVQGRITPQNADAVLQNCPVSMSDTLHYICGPAGLKSSVKEVLRQRGVADERILSEDFEANRDPAAFNDLITQYVSIINNGNAAQVEVVAGKSILEAGLDALLELPYSCQTGNCQVCKGRVIKGEIKMIGAEKQSALLGADECLLCSTFPLSNNVEIVVE